MGGMLLKRLLKKERGRVEVRRAVNPKLRYERIEGMRVDMMGK